MDGCATITRSKSDFCGGVEHLLQECVCKHVVPARNGNCPWQNLYVPVTPK